MNLSKNFTLAEFLKSNTAKKYKINNLPNNTHIERMKVLCEEVLQPARDHFKSINPNIFIKITSGYRNVKLSRKLGSSKRSFHVFGYAADCELYIKQEDGSFKEENELLFNYIKECLPYTELINEYDFSWVHIAYNPHDSRRMIKVIT
jgi:zinc D-Ala-D-Ala carboxypeptidase